MFGCSLGAGAAAVSNSRSSSRRRFSSSLSLPVRRAAGSPSARASTSRSICRQTRSFSVSAESFAPWFHTAGGAGPRAARSHVMIVSSGGTGSPSALRQQPMNWMPTPLCAGLTHSCGLPATPGRRNRRLCPKTNTLLDTARQHGRIRINDSSAGLAAKRGRGAFPLFA
jgi:hypothetical protein